MLNTNSMSGCLVACVSIRDIASGSIESAICSSVLEAVHRAFTSLSDQDGKTAVVVLGEDDSAAAVETELVRRASALAESVGQAGLFLTLAAQDVVRDRLTYDVRFDDFGVHGGVDDMRAERLYSVLHPDLPEPAIPHKKISGNCPRLHKSFVGRHREVDELQDLILNRKLVTITGSPGVGKTATAIHVARSFDDEYEDGVWWFSVDDRASLDELLQAIVSAPGLISMRGTLSVERVAAGLANKRCVIILDGCESKAEQIRAFCTEVIAQSESLTLLLTSTRSLGIQGEHIFRLNPMSLPRPGDVGEDALIVSDALTLFFDRASQSGVQLALDDKTVGLAIEVCERVDGLPIAIELVAASLRTSSLKKLVGELSQDLVPLSSRSFGHPDREHSLENALLLSYGTLGPNEKALLHRLAMFQGEWSVEIFSRIWGPTFHQPDIEGMHQILHDSSWLAYDPDHDAYRMLHTLRSFSWEHGGAKEATLLSDFCMGVAGLAASICAEVTGTPSVSAELLLRRHYSDFVFSLGTALKRNGNKECATHLMGSMVHFWLRGNLLQDAERFSIDYLKQATSELEIARVYVMLGVVNLRRGNLTVAADNFEKCLRLARTLGNRVAEAAALSNLGMTMRDKSEYEKAIAYYDLVLGILRESNQPRQLCGALCNSADSLIRLARLPRVGQRKKIKLLADAEASLNEAKSMSSDLDAWTLQALWHNYGVLSVARGDFDSAVGYLSKSVGLCAKHDMRYEAWPAIEVLAEVSVSREQWPSAAKFLGLSSEIQKESSRTPTELELERFGRLCESVNRQIGTERAEKLMRYGSKLDLAEIFVSLNF